MRKGSHSVLTACLLLLAGSLATFASPHKIPRTDRPIKSDGIPDEPAWEQAWSAELPFEVTPGENTPAVVRTEVYLIHDRTHLYAAFRAYDPEPDKIRAHLTDRDSAWADDWVGVVFDTFNDERRNYLLVVNPAGVQMDNIENWPGGGTEWDGIWDSAARITKWGWAAEIKVPFSSLRFQRSDEPQTWGFDAIRGYPRNIFRQMGSFARDRNNNCLLCQAIKIEGFEEVSPGKNLEIVPTITGARNERRSDLPDGDYDIRNDDLEPGVTARWGMTPNLTLGATLNPDFSQVEADASQLDINEPFTLFYPEKRPFFMEGSDYFNTPLDVVYTRTMHDPSWGLKVTGKEGPNTIGAYVLEDEATNVILPGPQTSTATRYDTRNTSAVLRYKRDIGNKYTMGALATSRHGDGYHNDVAGLDGDFRLTEKDRLTVQFLGSETEDPGDTASFSDTAYELMYLRDTRQTAWWMQYRDIGPEFRADLGFMPRVGITHTEGGGQYLWTGGDDDWYSKLLLIAKIAETDDHDGNLLKKEYAVRFNYEGFLQSHAYIRPSRVREGWNGFEFDINEIETHVCMKPNGDSHAWFNFITGDRIDYAGSRLGERININTGFWYRIGRHLLVEPYAIYEKLDVGDEWLYKARISYLTTAWQFNARMFLRAIAQHIDYRYGSGEERERLFTQFLFSYKLNPQTVFFLGYSDMSQGTQSFDLTRADRTFFIKLGYAWVM